MSARPIGELIAPILACAEAMAGFQRMLNEEPCSSERKRMILDAFSYGLIDQDDATLLVQVYQLETA